jgi:hypothetical protein
MPLVPMPFSAVAAVQCSTVQSHRDLASHLYFVTYSSKWKSFGSAAGIATGYFLDDRNVEVRDPVGARIFTSPYRPDRLWGPLRIIPGSDALFAEELDSCIVLLFMVYPLSDLHPKLDGKNVNRLKLAEIKQKRY